MERKETKSRWWKQIDDYNNRRMRTFMHLTYSAVVLSVVRYNEQLPSYSLTLINFIHTYIYVTCIWQDLVSIFRSQSRTRLSRIFPLSSFALNTHRGSRDHSRNENNMRDARATVHPSCRCSSPDRAVQPRFWFIAADAHCARATGLCKISTKRRRSTKH